MRVCHTPVNIIAAHLELTWKYLLGVFFLNQKQELFHFTVDCYGSYRLAIYWALAPFYYDSA